MSTLESRVLVCLMALSLLSGAAAQNHLYTFFGSSNKEELGYSASGGGDLDNDGYVDVVVGARFADYNGTDSGSVTVFSGKDGRVIQRFDGDSPGDRLGTCVRLADVNKDGFPDVIAGAPLDDNNGTDSGSVRVYSGLWLALKAGPQVLYTFNGDSAGDQVGWSVSGAGDVNNDGYGDIVVGSRFDDNNGTDSGSARVYSGKDGQILYTFNGDSAGDSFGRSVAGIGDLNKDGYGELLVGAIYDDNNGTDCGMARVFSGKDGTVLHTLNGDSAGDRFGIDVADAGDVNNDGTSDFVVGAYLDDNGGTDSGMARVFSGKDGTVLYTFNGDKAGDQLGVTVAGAGDINKDGHADLIVGARLGDGSITDSGYARVLSGKGLALTTDTHAFSLAKANTQTLSLDAGSTHKARLYWVFGSVTGTSPGVTLGSAIGPVTIPLNPDPWTDLTIALPNSPVLVNTKGVLDQNGQAQAQIKGGPVNAPSAIGLVLYHAYLVYDASFNFYMASNPATLLLEK